MKDEEAFIWINQLIGFYIPSIKTEEERKKLNELTEWTMKLNTKK